MGRFANSGALKTQSNLICLEKNLRKEDAEKGQYDVQVQLFFFQDTSDLQSFYDRDTEEFFVQAMFAGASKDLLIEAMNDWEKPQAGTEIDFDYSSLVSPYFSYVLILL